jgi:predicted amidophosphoribosyltransferase
MPFCPECGKNVGTSQKFCRSCGASLIDESPAAAAPPAPPSGGLTCRTCGAPLAPDEKFCGSCGTKAGDALVPSPALPSPAPVYQQPPAPPLAYQAPAPVYHAPPPPPPQYAAPPAPAAAPPAAGLVCKACGNPIKPGDKYCSKCLVIVPGSPAAAPAAYAPPAPVYQAPPPPAPVYQAPPPPPPQYAAPPAPAAAPTTAGLVCKACGNPIKPGDKFCSKCLVKVPTSPAPAPVYQAPPPASQPLQPPAAASAPGGYVCSSCGSPVDGSEKFCGICGSPVVAAKPPAPPAPPAGKFCGSCGAAISGTTKFCGSCGAPVTTAPSGGGDASFRPLPPVTAGREEVVGVIANARKVKFLGASWDTWNLVITNRRMIMVQMTAAMMNAAVAEAQAKARAEGKGFFGIMKDQLSAQFGYAVRYETMNPDQALVETPGNIAVENGRITAINMKLKDTGSGDVEYTEFRMSVVSADGTFEYLMAEDDRYITLLKQVYGDTVHMPFGYFRVGAARIKFF